MILEYGMRGTLKSVGLGDVKESVRRAFKRIRLEMGLTQEQMAERLECKRQTITSYEAGRAVPSASAFLRLWQISPYRNQSVDRVRLLFAERES